MEFLKVKMICPNKAIRTLENVELDSYGNLVQRKSKRVIYTEDEIKNFDFDKIHKTDYTLKTLKTSIKIMNSFALKCEEKNGQLNTFKFWVLENEHYYEFYDSNDELINLENLIKK